MGARVSRVSERGFCRYRGKIGIDRAYVLPLYRKHERRVARLGQKNGVPKKWHSKFRT